MAPTGNAVIQDARNDAAIPTSEICDCPLKSEEETCPKIIHLESTSPDVLRMEDNDSRIGFSMLRDNLDSNDDDDDVLSAIVEDNLSANLESDVLISC